MADSYLYYRIRIGRNNGDANFTGLLEFELRETPGGTNYAAAANGGVATSSTNFAGAGPEKAIDGSLASGSGWASATGSVKGQWVQVQLSEARAITEYKVGSHVSTTNTAARSAKDWVVFGSNDGSTWTPLHLVTDQTGWTFGELRTFTIPETIAASLEHYLLWVQSNNGDATFSGTLELELRESPGGTNYAAAANGGSATATSEGPSAGPANAIDGDTSVSDFGWLADEGIEGEWLEIQLSSARAIAEYKLYSGSLATRSLTAWTLYGSEDGVSWKPLHVVSGETGWTLGEVRTFEIESSAAVLSLDQTLADFVLSGALTVEPRLSLDQTLAAIVLSGSMSVPARLSLDQVIAAIQLQGTLGTALPTYSLIANLALSSFRLRSRLFVPVVRRTVPGAGVARTRTVTGAGSRAAIRVQGAGARPVLVFGLPVCTDTGNGGGGGGVGETELDNEAFDVLLVCDDNENAVFTQVEAGEFTEELTQAEVNEYARMVIEAQGLEAELDCSSPACEAATGEEAYGSLPFDQICFGGTWYSDFSPVANRWEFRTQ